MTSKYTYCVGLVGAVDSGSAARMAEAISSELAARLLEHVVEELRKPAPKQTEVDAMSVSLLRKSDLIQRLIEKVSQL